MLFCSRFPGGARNVPRNAATSGVAALAAALVIGVLAPAPAQAQNLVTNPGFETGSFSGWSVTPAASGSFLFVSAVRPHTGTYDAVFGAINGQDDTISQTIATTAGSTYNFSFYLRNEGAGRDHFAAFFDNNKVYETTNTTASNYTLFSYNLTASSSSTQIRFAGNAGISGGFLLLDDVNVSKVSDAAVTPEAPAMVNLAAALLAPGMGGFVAFRRRKKAHAA